MQIDKKNDGVAFNDAEHVYWNLETNQRYISVTTLIEKFGKPFDKEFWSGYKALEKLLSADQFKIEKPRLLDTKKLDKQYYFDTYDLDEDKFNAEQQAVLDAWQEENFKSCERGTKIHAGIEQGFLDSGVCELPTYGLGGKFTVRSGDVPLDEEKGVYPEYLIHVDDGNLHLAGQIDLLIKDGNDIYILDWKGLPLDTPIATPTGFTNMQDLQVGDKVFDKDGNICNVTVKSEVHNNPCYKISFDNGESIIADVDHRWLVSFRNPDNSFRDKVMTTLEIKEHIDKIDGKRTSYNIPKIVNPEPLNLPDVELPIDPYVLGCWLGDGSASCGIITNEVNNIWGEIKKRGFEISEDLSEPDKAEMHTVYGLRTQLRKLNLLDNKHIPDIYFRASYNQRLDLLRGLMDTDGYFNIKRLRYCMETSQEWQRDGLIELLATLGIKSSTFKITKKLDGKKFTAWAVNFTTNNFNPFLSRNQDVHCGKNDKNSFRIIKSVDPVDMVPTQCIQVDSPSHTFLCTKSLIVTHNTNKQIETKGFFNRKTKTTEKMLYPLSDLDECNFSHYTLQLSMYAWMIQHNNPDFNIKRLKLVHFDHDDNRTEYEIEYKKSTVERLIRYWKKQVVIEERKKLREPIEF